MNVFRPSCKKWLNTCEYSESCQPQNPRLTKPQSGYLGGTIQISDYDYWGRSSLILFIRAWHSSGCAMVHTGGPFVENRFPSISPWRQGEGNGWREDKGCSSLKPMLGEFHCATCRKGNQLDPVPLHRSISAIALGVFFFKLREISG